MKKGFFGTFALLCAIQIILLLNSNQLEILTELAEAKKTINNIEEANFIRAEKEILFDRKIQQITEYSSLINTDPEFIKKAINLQIIYEFNNIESEKKGICNETPEGTIFKKTPITLDEVEKITKIIKYKAGNLTTIQYLVTGGISKNDFLCAQIKKGNYSSIFTLPPGYSYTAMRLSE